MPRRNARHKRLAHQVGSSLGAEVSARARGLKLRSSPGVCGAKLELGSVWAHGSSCHRVAGDSGTLRPVTDLVIGKRRTGPKPTLRGVGIATLVVIVALLVAHIIYRRVVSYVEPDGSVPNHPVILLSNSSTPGDNRLGFGESSLAHAGGIAVLRLVGEPHTLGASHGRLLGDSVTKISRTVNPCIWATVSRCRD